MSPFLRHQLQASVNRSDRRAVIEDWETSGRRRRDAREAFELRWAAIDSPCTVGHYWDGEGEVYA